MRIGLFVDTYKPFMSGITYFVSQHKRALEAMGHKVFVFTLGHMDYEDEELYIYRSPAIPVTETGYQLGFIYSRVARRKIKTMDILHTQHPFISGSLAVTYGKRHGIPVIFTNHSRYDKMVPHYVPTLTESISEVLLETYLLWFAEQCQAVTTPTRTIQRLLRKYGITVRMPVIPNGVDLAPFRAPAHLQTRAALGLPQDALVSIYVGRIASEKNLSFLLRAFAHTSQQVSNAYLVIVGHGPLEQDLRDQAQELNIAQRTIFIGQVPYEQVPGYLAMADIFVTASVIEVQPLSIIEGLATGLPAIAISSDAVIDTLTDNHDSLLTDYNTKDYARKWQRLLSDDDLRARLAANAGSSSQRYDIHRTAAQMLELYQQVIVESGRRQEPQKKEAIFSLLKR